MDKSMYYVVIVVTLAALALILVPKQLYKRFFLYGIIFGGLGDGIMVFILAKTFGLMQYKHLGIFGLFGMFTIWTPLSWTFAFMLFFYLLPVRKIFLGVYLLVFIILQYSVGLVMQGMGLYEYRNLEHYLAPVIFLVWDLVATWAYLKSERIELK